MGLKGAQSGALHRCVAATSRRKETFHLTHRVRVLTAALLIAVPVLFMLFYGLLMVTFDYPGILREPAGEVVRRFAAGGPSLVLLWYGFALTPVLFIPAAILLRRVFAATSPLLDLAVPLGVLAGLTQVLGLIRWPFLVPELARTFLDPALGRAPPGVLP